MFEKHLKAINAEVHGRFFYSSYGLFIDCVFPFSFLLFVFFINLQYFQVQARVLAHGSYTLAKKPFDKSAVYNDLESKKNDPTGTDGTIKKGGELRSRVLFCEVRARREDDACLS